MKNSLRDRFDNAYTPEPNTGCWLWTRASDRYGFIKVAGRMRFAHRVSYELHFGPIPNGMYVCHHCDNGLCVNPDHLFIGTARDNYEDMCRKGRRASPRGELGPQAKLTWAEAIAVRRTAEAHSEPQHAIAARYGVTQGLVTQILHRKIWWPEPGGEET